MVPSAIDPDHVQFVGQGGEVLEVVRGVGGADPDEVRRCRLPAPRPSRWCSSPSCRWAWRCRCAESRGRTGAPAGSRPHGQPLGDRGPVDAVAVDGAAGDVDVVQLGAGAPQQAEQPHQFRALIVAVVQKTGSARRPAMPLLTRSEMIVQAVGRDFVGVDEVGGHLQPFARLLQLAGFCASGSRAVAVVVQKQVRVVGDGAGGQAQGLHVGDLPSGRRWRQAMLARFMKGSPPVITISLIAGVFCTWATACFDVGRVGLVWLRDSLCLRKQKRQ